MKNLSCKDSNETANCVDSLIKFVHYVGPRSRHIQDYIIGSLFGLMLNVPVINFSVMSGRSHSFLGITSTFSGSKINVSLLKDTYTAEVEVSNALLVDLLIEIAYKMIRNGWTLDGEIYSIFT